MRQELTAEARLGVIDLIANYAHTLESGDIDAYLDNFTPDGVFEGRSGRYEGRDAIRALITHLYAIGQDGPGGNRHILGLPNITATPEGCTAQTYFVIPAASGEESVLIRSIGQYTDRIVQHDGRWRFAHRYLDQLFKKTGGQ